MNGATLNIIDLCLVLEWYNNQILSSIQSSSHSPSSFQPSTINVQSTLNTSCATANSVSASSIQQNSSNLIRQISCNGNAASHDNLEDNTLVKSTTKNNCEVIKGNPNLDVGVNYNTDERMKINRMGTLVPIHIHVEVDVDDTVVSNEMPSSPLNLSCNKRSERGTVQQKESETLKGLRSCKHRYKLKFLQ